MLPVQQITLQEQPLQTIPEQQIIFSDSIVKDNQKQILKDQIYNHGQICATGSALTAGLSLQYQQQWLSIAGIVCSSLSVMFHQLSQEQTNQSEIKRAQKKNVK